MYYSFVVDPQIDRFDKIALCVESCKIAKNQAVKEFGIGEDLPFTIFGWNGAYLICVAQLSYEFMLDDPKERVGKTAFCATLLRRGWACDSFTFMAEGYASSDIERTKGRSLNEVFVEPDSPVDECLTFTHVDSEGPHLVIVPYRQEVGRRVVWSNAQFQKEAQGLRDAIYPSVFMEALKVEPDYDDYENHLTYQMTLVEGMAIAGFTVQFKF